MAVYVKAKYLSGFDEDLPMKNEDQRRLSGSSKFNDGLAVLHAVKLGFQ